MQKWILSATILVLGIGFAGCSSETIQSAKSDIERNTASIRTEAERLEKVTRPVREAAKPVTDAVQREADKKLEQLKIGARVTAALKANENLPSSIRVDAGPDANRVTLRGTVKTAEQKRLAEQIARKTIGPNKGVQNDLTIAASETTSDKKTDSGKP